MRVNNEEYIEVDVLDVRAATQASEAFSLILVDRFHPSLYVPIIIGLNEARAILGEIHGRLPKRPLTHTLFADLFPAFIPDYHIEFVSIDSYGQGIYYASIVIQTPTGDFFEVDARPSDAVAIALHASVPLYFKKVLFEEHKQVAQRFSDYGMGLLSETVHPAAPSRTPHAATEWETMSLSELKDLLQAAIDDENYELAAKIQEEIDRRHQE